jgi:3-deoxy-7-phosphoheptulonate synthase
VTTALSPIPTEAFHALWPEGDLAWVRLLSALQQPDWEDSVRLEEIRGELRHRPPLVRADDIRALRSRLARVALGELHVLQSGDCAEDPAEATAGDVARKADLLGALADVLELSGGKPVLRVGRIAGQFAKPRSKPTEWVGGVELPVYRGHMVNGPEPDPVLRRPDPERLLAGHRAAQAVHAHLGWHGAAPGLPVESRMWTSHEALLLDYELPLVRRDEQGRALLTSTHWPWIGERTRQADGAHVALLAAVANPVACKVGPTMAVDELLELCARLDPGREPGRLTLIARMGVQSVARALPPLVAAVRAAGHPVIWLTDPMHGNTVNGPDGLKTRYLETLALEVREFQLAVRSANGVAGGLHLETTPDDVTECVVDASQVHRVGEKYTSFCDPRLNPAQAAELVSRWRG